MSTLDRKKKQLEETIRGRVEASDRPKARHIWMEISGNCTNGILMALEERTRGKHAEALVTELGAARDQVLLRRSARKLERKHLDPEVAMG